MNQISIPKLFAVIILLTSVLHTYAQDEETPVYDPWAGSYLIDNQTSVIPYEKHFQFVIHHRFGTFENGLSDLFGIYAPSNIRMGFNYAINSKMMVGIGTEKNHKTQELLWKYNILEQTQSNSMPITLTYFGNMALNASDESNFGQDYKFIHRLSYFNQLIISRKFSDKLSLMAAPGFVHFNIADSLYQNQRFTYMVGGKYNVYNNINLLAEYHNSFSVNETDADENLEGSLSFAAEIMSATHTFQITLAQFREIIPQYNHSYNTNGLDGGWSLGFNIIVRFY